VDVSNLRALCLITAKMGGLQIIPIFRSFRSRVVTKQFVLADWSDLIDHERQGVG
jgi:hypothetical protein